MICGALLKELRNYFYLFLLVELQHFFKLSDKREVYEIKRRTEIDVVLENCPIQLIKFAEHLRFDLANMPHRVEFH